jgi:hypothetical protein
VQKRHLLLLPCLLLGLALALSACGGGGSSSDESAQIEEAIEVAATSTKPSDCAKYTTQGFMEQTTATEGKGAVAECEKEAKEGNTAESAKVSDVEVDGSEATAEASFTGGSLNAQSLEIALLKEGDQWQLNELVGFTNLDRGALAKSLGAQLSEGGGEAAELAPCVEKSFGEADQTEVEELLLAGSPKLLEELVEGCE